MKMEPFHMAFAYAFVVMHASQRPILLRSSTALLTNVYIVSFVGRITTCMYIRCETHAPDIYNRSEHTCRRVRVRVLSILDLP
jgi:hypothetical protein